MCSKTILIANDLNIHSTRFLKILACSLLNALYSQISKLCKSKHIKGLTIYSHEKGPSPQPPQAALSAFTAPLANLGRRMVAPHHRRWDLEVYSIGARFLHQIHSLEHLDPGLVLPTGPLICKHTFLYYMSDDYCFERTCNWGPVKAHTFSLAMNRIRVVCTLHKCDSYAFLSYYYFMLY